MVWHLLKTDEKGLDEKVSKYAEDKNLDISYVNVKKVMNLLIILFY